MLARSQLHGLQTNRELLVRILRHPEFLPARLTHTFSNDTPLPSSQTAYVTLPANDCMPAGRRTGEPG